MAKSAQRLQARTLRKDGMSIQNIAKHVSNSKSTISRWCSDIVLTDDQIQKLIEDDREGARRGRLIASRNKQKERAERVESYQLEAFHDVEAITNRDMFMLGIGLYWAEGCKQRGQVIFANTDPVMIKAFLAFIHHTYKEEFQVSCRIQLNIDHKDRYQEVLRYWIRELKLTKDQFRQPSFIHTKHKKIFKTRSTYYGVMQIRIRKSTNLNYKMCGYINSVKYSIESRARVAQW